MTEPKVPAPLTAGQILAAADRPQPVRVQVPEWSGFVYVREMTAGERDRYEKQLIDSRAGGPFLPRAWLAVLTICDAEGKRLFADDQAGEIAKRSAAALDRVFDAASALNGLGAGDIEDAEKNSSAGPSAGSSSASPSPSA
jgi:hypothetical protein